MNVAYLRRVTTILLALYAVPARAVDTPVPQALVSGVYVFPSAANVLGAFGAHFQTRIVLTNPSTETLTIEAVLSTSDGALGPHQIILQPRSIKTFENFLQDVFAYTGGAGFTLRATTGRPFMVAGEVYAEGPNGRFSTPLVPLSSDDAVADSRAVALSLATGVRVDSANRANFGCTNTAGASVTVATEFYTSAGGLFATPAARVDLFVKAGGWAQQSVPVTDPNITIRFVVPAGTASGATYCYGVTVNNTSNDGTVAPAIFEPAF